jgi:hypothetical protein
VEQVKCRCAADRGRGRAVVAVNGLAKACPFNHVSAGHDWKKIIAQ